MGSLAVEGMAKRRIPGALARLALALTTLGTAALVAPSGAAAGDLETALETVGPRLGRRLNTSFDLLVFGFAPCGEVCALGGFDLLSQVGNTIVYDRVIPRSNGAASYTYEFNEDKGVYERSGDTFGPLFGEGARTIGRGLFRLGMSYSYLEFDEFEGESI